MFTKNRDRLLKAEVAKFLACVVEQTRVKDLTSDEHFTVAAHCWSVGESEEFPAQAGFGIAAAGRSRKSHSELSRRETVE